MFFLISIKTNQNQKIKLKCPQVEKEQKNIVGLTFSKHIKLPQTSFESKCGKCCCSCFIDRYHYPPAYFCSRGYSHNLSCDYHECLQIFMPNEFGDISFFSKTKSMKCLQTSSQSEFGDIDTAKMNVGHNNPLCVSKLFVFLLCRSIP